MTVFDISGNVDIVCILALPTNLELGTVRLKLFVMKSQGSRFRSCKNT